MNRLMILLEVSNRSAALARPTRGLSGHNLTNGIFNFCMLLHKYLQKHIVQMVHNSC
ncbi:hypothetical protein [Clostridium neonatale]|uniref:hypothetical protein n=1 Tax=Clostridium neonatale TaxID=137838 RepID=UPI00313FFF9A